MKSLNNNKGTVVAIVVFALLFSVYNIFKADLMPVFVPQENIGADVVELYAGLQSVTLNKELLASPLYRALVDSSTEIAPQPTGRPNPFSVIGVD